MTLEEAQKLIERGSKEKNYQMIEEGLAAIKEVEKSQDFVAPIARKAPTGPGVKNYGHTESIDLRQATAFNMFDDTGKEHKEHKLKSSEKGAWGTIGRARAEAKYVSVTCGSCGDEYETPPLFAKRIEINPDGTTHNPNFCNSCLIKRKPSR